MSQTCHNVGHTAVSVDVMTLRLKTLFDFLGAPRHEQEVHFHSGPDALPAVCFDGRCGMPRLDV